MMDRATAAHHLAKVFAYLGCGKVEEARSHARLLVQWLEGVIAQ